MRIGFGTDGTVGTVVRTAWTSRRHNGIRVDGRDVKGGGAVTVLPLIPTLCATLGDAFPDDDDDARADRAAAMATSLATTLASVENGVSAVAPGALTLRVREGRDDAGDPTWAYVIGRGKSGGRTLTLDHDDVISSSLRTFAYAAHVARS